MAIGFIGGVVAWIATYTGHAASGLGLALHTSMGDSEQAANFFMLLLTRGVRHARVPSPPPCHTCCVDVHPPDGLGLYGTSLSPQQDSSLHALALTQTLCGWSSTHRTNPTQGSEIPTHSYALYGLSRRIPGWLLGSPPPGNEDSAFTDSR